MSKPLEVTQLLAAARDGSTSARDEVLHRVYDELRGLAERCLRRERPDHSLQATALVHEAYVRLVKGNALPGGSRTEFLTAAARAMRCILIDHARHHDRAKRGGGRERVPLHSDILGAAGPTVDLLALDEALESLAEIDSRKSRVVELRFFGGLTVDEAAEVLDVSTATVERDWEIARMWLHRQLTRGDRDGD